MLQQSALIRQLSESEIYRDYESAFSEATHLPLQLRPHEVWQHAMGGKKYANPFCVLLAKSSKSCAACLEVQDQLTKGAQEKTATTTCFAGLCDTAVPVSVGGAVIGFLQTGQVALRRPNRAGFERVARQLIEWGTQVDLRKLEDAYFHSKLLTPKQYASMVRLLEIFAKHLSAFANQILVQESTVEPPLVARAKRFIGERSGDPVSLGNVAQALSVSTFHFCKVFRKATGLTFTELPGPHPHRKSAQPPPQPEPARQRDRLRVRVRLARPFQPDLQEGRRLFAHRISKGLHGCDQVVKAVK